MIFQHHDYRSYLKEVLVKRARVNPAYSLRLFAMELGLSPSSLSEVLQGKKKLSLERSAEVARRLELEPTEREYLELLVRLGSCKNPKVRQELCERIARTSEREAPVDLSIDYFAIISDWYHIPILMLPDVVGFQFTAPNIARRLGITVPEAEVAVDRLLRLDLLEKTESGSYRRVPRGGSFKSYAASEALRNFHTQMLQRASEALRTQDNDEKFVGTQTFAVDRQQLPEARKRLQRFLADMVELFDTGTKKTDVYHLGVQLFNVRGNEK